MVRITTATLLGADSPKHREALAYGCLFSQIYIETALQSQVSVSLMRGKLQMLAAAGELRMCVQR